MIGGVSGGHNGNPDVKVASYMLGGGAYHWMDGGKELAVNERSDVKLAESNTEWRFYSESLAEDAPIVKAAEALAKVYIEGNSADHGGAAIGSNGDVVIGEPDAVLRLEKIVESDDANDGLREFTAEVKLSGTAGEISAELTRIKADGTMETSGVSFNEAEPKEIRIRGGEIVLLRGIPAGTKYTVVESDVNSADSTEVWWTETAQTERTEEVVWNEAADGVHR